MTMLQEAHTAPTDASTATLRPAPTFTTESCLPPFGSREIVRGGGTIYAQEDHAAFIYKVALGMVRTTSLARDGRRVVRGFHVAGDLFGIEREEVHGSSAEAIGDVHLERCERAGLEQLAAADRSVARKLWEWLLASAERAERLSVLGRGSAVEKLAYFLIDLAERVSASRRLELPMSRADIGDYLGLSSETVSRSFTVLRRKGLIATDGRFVFLLNAPALRRLNGNLLGVGACSGEISAEPRIHPGDQEGSLGTRRMACASTKAHSLAREARGETRPDWSRSP
jgi:CRP-like cAMP-binding protein